MNTKKRFLIGLVMLLILSGGIQSIAQKPDYENLSLYDVTLKDFLNIRQLMGENGLVLIFTSSYCPYVELYEERIMSLKEEFSAKKINFALINSNNTVGQQTETIEKMREESKVKNVRIISDQNHDIKEAFGASKTPEVVVFRIKENKIEKAYQGAIDDSPKTDSMVKKDYLRQVLVNLAQGKPSPVRDTRPIGCLIK